MATKYSSKAAFDHVLDVILERDDSTPLKRALLQQGYNDIHALAILSDDVINSLTHDDPKGKVDVPILNFEKALISAFLDFIIHRNNINNPVGSDWKSITKEEFDDFRIDPTYLAQRRNLPTTFGISSISATPSTIPKLSPPTSDVTVVLDPSFVYKTPRLTANRRSANDYQDDFDDRKQDWSLQPDDIFDTHPIAYQTETRVLSHDRSPQNIFDFARFTDRKTNGNLGDGEIKSVPQNIFDFARFTDRKSNGNLGDGEIMSVHVGLCGPGNQPPPSS
jgi:hypothetical protein